MVMHTLKNPHVTTEKTKHFVVVNAQITKNSSHAQGKL